MLLESVTQRFRAGLISFAHRAGGLVLAVPFVDTHPIGVAPGLASPARRAKLISPARERWVSVPNLFPEPLLRGGTIRGWIMCVAPIRGCQTKSIVIHSSRCGLISFLPRGRTCSLTILSRRNTNGMRVHKGYGQNQVASPKGETD